MSNITISKNKNLLAKKTVASRVLRKNRGVSGVDNQTFRKELSEEYGCEFMVDKIYYKGSQQSYKVYLQTGTFKDCGDFCKDFGVNKNNNSITRPIASWVAKWQELTTPKKEIKVYEMTFEEFNLKTKCTEKVLGHYGREYVVTAKEKYENELSVFGSYSKTGYAQFNQVTNPRDAKIKCHKEYIKDAIANQKLILAEVLAEYPDLLREKAKTLLQLYKNDNQGLQGLGAKSVDLFGGLMTYTPNNTGLGYNFDSDAEIEKQAKKRNLGLLLAVEFALFSVMKQLDVSFEKVKQYLDNIYSDMSEIEMAFCYVISSQYEKPRLTNQLRKKNNKSIIANLTQELKKFEQEQAKLVEELKELTKTLRLPSKAIVTDADDNEKFWITEKEFYAIRDRYAAGKKNEFYPVSMTYSSDRMAFEFITDTGRFKSVLWNMAELADRMQKTYSLKPNASLESLLSKNTKVITDNTLVISELHSKILKKFVSTDEMRGQNMKTINSNSNGYGATNSHSIFFFPHTETTKKLQGCYRFDGTLTNEKLLLSDETMINLRPNIIAAEIEIHVADFLKFVKYKHTNDKREAGFKRFFYKDIFVVFDKKLLGDVIDAFKLLKYSNIFLHINQNNRGVYVFSAERRYTDGIYSFIIGNAMVQYGDYYPKNDETDEMGNGLIWYDLENGYYPATFDEPIAKTSQTPKLDAAKLQAKAAKQAKKLLNLYKNDSQGLQGIKELSAAHQKNYDYVINRLNKEIALHGGKISFKVISKKRPDEPYLSISFTQKGSAKPFPYGHSVPLYEDKKEIDWRTDMAIMEINGILYDPIYMPILRKATDLLAGYKKDNEGLRGLGDMPTVLREEGFKFFFYSNDHLPVHIHIEKGDAKAKFHLEPNIELVYNQGFTQKEIKKIREIITENHKKLVNSWHNFFDK